MRFGTFVQFGRGMTEYEITERLLMSLADKLDGPIHFVPAVAILQPSGEWPVRGILNVRQAH